MFTIKTLWRDLYFEKKARDESCSKETSFIFDYTFIKLKIDYFEYLRDVSIVAVIFVINILQSYLRSRRFHNSPNKWFHSRVFYFRPLYHILSIKIQSMMHFLYFDIPYWRNKAAQDKIPNAIRKGRCNSQQFRLYDSKNPQRKIHPVLSKCPIFSVLSYHCTINVSAITDALTDRNYIKGRKNFQGTIESIRTIGERSCENRPGVCFIGLS